MPTQKEIRDFEEAEATNDLPCVQERYLEDLRTGNGNRQVRLRALR
jgi:hypothetical protein